MINFNLNQKKKFFLNLVYVRRIAIDQTGKRA